MTLVSRFHDALAAGDTATVQRLLAPDLTVLESGGVETRAAYFAHHLAADIESAKAVKGPRTLVSYATDGNTAWLAATLTAKGSFRGRDVNSIGAELMVLTRSASGWQIRAIRLVIAQSHLSDGSVTAVSARLCSPSSAARRLLPSEPETQHVLARELPEITVRPATVDQLREKRGIGGDVLEPLHDLRDPVEVAADPHVIGAGYPPNVLNVVGDLGQRCARSWVCHSPCLRPRA